MRLDGCRTVRLSERKVNSCLPLPFAYNVIVTVPFARVVDSTL
jgi:hypothetical protein